MAALKQIVVTLHQFGWPQRLEAAVENCQSIFCRAAPSFFLRLRSHHKQSILRKLLLVARNQCCCAGKVLACKFEGQFPLINCRLIGVAPLPACIFPLCSSPWQCVPFHHFQRSFPRLPRLLCVSLGPAFLGIGRSAPHCFKRCNLLLRLQSSLIEVGQIQVRCGFVAGVRCPALPVLLCRIKIQRLFIFHGPQRVKRCAVLRVIDKSRQFGSGFARRTPIERLFARQLHQPVKRLLHARARFCIFKPARNAVAGPKQQSGTLPHHQRSVGVKACTAKRHRNSGSNKESVLPRPEADFDEVDIS